MQQMSALKAQNDLKLQQQVYELSRLEGEADRERAALIEEVRIMRDII